MRGKLPETLACEGGGTKKRRKLSFLLNISWCLYFKTLWSLLVVIWYALYYAKWDQLVFSNEQACQSSEYAC